MRTDIHRPSVIQPEDYCFVECVYHGPKQLDMLECMENAEAKERVRKHMERTGGKYSSHEHGGSCFVCGACCNYQAIFYHPTTNTYIRTGEECAAKLGDGEAKAFNSMRRAIDNAMEAKAGKMKAQAILAELGLSRAWEIYCDHDIAATTLRDIVNKLVKYGSLSDRQAEFLGKLVNEIDNAAAIEAQRATEAEAAAPCPTGRVVVEGEVLSTRVDDGQFGTQIKMLVKADSGYKVWGTVPSSLTLVEDTPITSGDFTWTPTRALRRGDRVRFTATLTPSERDPKFGIAKRPSKAELLCAS